MKACVVVFPGSNCDRDVKVALEARRRRAGAAWSGTRTRRVPALRPDRAARRLLPTATTCAAAPWPPIRPSCATWWPGPRPAPPVLGICNGFQVLTETGLLPGVLMRNASLKFVCRDVHLKVEQPDTLFTNHYRQGEVIRIPIAHGDGNYFADDGHA